MSEYIDSEARKELSSSNSNSDLLAQAVNAIDKDLVDGNHEEEPGEKVSNSPTRKAPPPLTH